MAVAPGTALAGDSRAVRIIDRCDPATFDAAIGPGTCIGDGNVTFQRFVDRLNPHDGGHNAWRFNPEKVSLHRGQRLVADNVGGETHTFTEVVAFGTGIVPFLDAALPPGSPPAVPIGDPRFLAPGQEASLSLSPGTHRFECLIHPWMQTTVEQRRR